MFRIKAKNSSGECITLTDNSAYAITNITGLSPSAATINTATIGNNDGSMFNSSRVNQRNIVLTIRLIENVEASRIALYNYFKAKQSCRLYCTTDNRDVYIDGYVESMQCDFFTNEEAMQISIICPSPFFRNINEAVSVMSHITPFFEFPFDIDANGIEFSEVYSISTAEVFNVGDIETGMIIELVSSGEVVNPSIINAETLESFNLNFTLQSGDKIVIDTIKGEKSVTLTRDGTESNIINSLGQYPDWLQLAIGENAFNYSADSGADNLVITIRHTDIYEGV